MAETTGSPDQEVFYMVEVMKASIEIDVFGRSFDLSLTDKDGLIGMMPVYGTLEQAQRAWPDYQVKALTRRELPVPPVW